MKWSHLPVSGGLYDQSPELLDGFRSIFAARAKHEKEEHDKQERERKQTMGRKPSRGSSSGRMRKR